MNWESELPFSIPCRGKKHPRLAPGGVGGPTPGGAGPGGPHPALCRGPDHRSGAPRALGPVFRSLPLDGVWDSGEARWVPLFTDGEVPPPIKARLARFQLALVFSPHPQTILLTRLHQAGIPAVHWLPSFPDFPEMGAEAVAALLRPAISPAWGLIMSPAPSNWR